MFQLALLLLLAGPCIAAPSADKKEIGKVETERDAGMMDIETEVEKRQYYGGSYFNSYGTFSGNSYGGDNGNSYVNSYIYGNSDGSEYGDSYGNNVSGDYDNSYGNSDGSDYGDSYGNNFSGNYDNSYGNSDGSDYGDSYGNNFSGDYDNSYGNSDASDYGDSYGNNYSHNNDYSSSYYSPDYDNSYSNNYGSSYSPQNYDYSSSYNSPDYDNSYSNNYGTTYSNQNNESSSSYYSPYYGNYGNYGNNSSNNIPLRLYPRSYEEKYIMNPATGIGYSNGSNYLPYTVKKWRIVAPTSCHQATHVRLWYDIEQHSTCDWDFLKISQSGSECSLCGKSHGVTDLGNLRGDINIYFKTDGSVQKRGFILWYRKVYTPCDGHTN